MGIRAQVDRFGDECDMIPCLDRLDDRSARRAKLVADRDGLRSSAVGGAVLLGIVWLLTYLDWPTLSFWLKVFASVVVVSTALAWRSTEVDIAELDRSDDPDIGDVS